MWFTHMGLGPTYKNNTRLKCLRLYAECRYTVHHYADCCCAENNTRL
jgi:hypothetical protein